MTRASSKVGLRERETELFDIEINDDRQVALVRFRGELSERDFAGLDALGAMKEADKPFDCIFDMTAVEKIDLATAFVSKRGELPQVYTDRHRIYVVPQDDLKLLVRLYAAYQRAKGWREPVVVATIGEAFAMLNLTADDFHATRVSSKPHPPAGRTR